MVEFAEILKKAQSYRADMTKFLRDMIRIPSESCEERDVVLRIKEEMEKVGFDKVVIDPMGNILGYIGHGKHVIAMDAHIDTVGIGDKRLWTECDPYEGKEDDNTIWGRGGSDQEGGMAAMVYAGKVIKDLGLEGDYTLIVTGSVQEEDCDGLCWQYIHNELGIKPEFVVITEPTSLRIYRGHRGRMEIRVETRGVSCHGSAPERGSNAIYKMADILQDIRMLNRDDYHEDHAVKGLGKMLDPKYNERWEDARFLGRGTVTTSQIFYTSPSRCAVADSCAISLDRRMTAGETAESCLEEIRNLPAVKKWGDDVTVSMYTYERPSYTNLVYPTECFFPTWCIANDHPACESLVEAYEGLAATDAEKRFFDEKPVVDKWTFSTNGVSIMGRYGIPCIGFGPGAEAQAHFPNEKTWKDHLVTCCAMYAAIPQTYLKKIGG